MAWPVQDCLMIEPTESEDKDEMDRFVDSLLAIREEIINIEKGVFDKEKNPLKVGHSFCNGMILKSLNFRWHHTLWKF